jgi:hypothetical protein
MAKRVRARAPGLSGKGGWINTGDATTEVAPGRLRLDVVFQAPAGQKLDTRSVPRPVC